MCFNIERGSAGTSTTHRSLSFLGSTPAAFIMNFLQRILVSVLVVLTFTFVFFAQTSQAVKGPKITHKVHDVTLVLLRLWCLTMAWV